MDMLGARPGRPVDECLKRIESVDAVIAIAGHRYGWVPTPAEGGDGDRSITWLEAAKAERCGKPIFAFIAEDNAPLVPGADEDHRSIEGLKAFKTFLEQRVRAKFVTPAELANGVIVSLVSHFGFLDQVPPAPVTTRSFVTNIDTNIGNQVNVETLNLSNDPNFWKRR